IRDFHVTGVQTCALPISLLRSRFRVAVHRTRSSGCRAARPESQRAGPRATASGTAEAAPTLQRNTSLADAPLARSNLDPFAVARSEERRVGKGSGSLWVR